MFGQRTRTNIGFRGFYIGILPEIRGALLLTSIRWIHLAGPDGKQVCGYARMDYENQVPQVPHPPAIIQCTKCSVYVRVPLEDQPLLRIAYQEALDPLSRSGRHCTGTVEFVLLSPVIVSAAHHVVLLPSTAPPRTPQRHLRLVDRDGNAH